MSRYDIYLYHNSHWILRSFFLQDFQNIKSIKKIKSITPIDDDLALQMKEEIENAKGLLNTVNNRLDPDPDPVDETDPDADFQMYDMNKIRRIKSEFSVAIACRSNVKTKLLDDIK